MYLGPNPTLQKRIETRGAQRYTKAYRRLGMCTDQSENNLEGILANKTALIRHQGIFWLVGTGNVVPVEPKMCLLC